MNKILQKFLIALSLILVTSCTESIDIQLKETLVRSDNVKQTVILTPKDESFKLLNQWLIENKDDWNITSGRYPGGIYIKSGDHGIQITNKKVIIYDAKTTKPRALYIKEISQNELSQIKELYLR